MTSKIIIGYDSATKKTKIQLRYEKLLQNIELKKEQLNNLQEGLRKVSPKIENELKPLMKLEVDVFSKRIIRLDEAATEIGIGKVNREYFDQYMAEQVSNLIEHHYDAPQELKNLYTKYTGEDFDLSEDDSTTEAQDMIKEVFGFDFDLEEMEEMGPEAYFDEYGEAFQEQFEDKPKNKREQARLKKEEEEQKLLEKDAKAVYMKLIKKFHPDRVQDTLLKEQYTEISTKITKAYQANDFLELLKLQIEYLDEKEADVSNLADDMLKRYNKILQQQLDELEWELEMSKRSSMGMYEDFFDKNHKFSQLRFNKAKKDILQNIKNIELDLVNSHKRPKGWLKEWTAVIKDVVQESMMRSMFSKMF